MMRPRDPRVRRTINQISHNLEAANETAQEGLYTFSHEYILPCFATIGNCISACTGPCIPSREDQLRRRRRGRAESIFDFYDDWDNDDTNDSLLGWGTDELDRLLAGSGLTRASSEQPRRPRRMSYGARRTRRKSGLLVPDDGNDPTVIPSSSFLGFLERFPWRWGARGLKYRPSAADLQEHPQGLRWDAYEEEPLIEAAEEAEGPSSAAGKNGRYRSSTQSSQETATSLSSRGDLIPSDEEEDAVPLDDEFAMGLHSRRGTGVESDDQLGDKPASIRSTSGTFSLATTDSKDSRKNKNKKKRNSRLRSSHGSYVDIAQVATLSLADLQKEDERAAFEEESEVLRKRHAAHQLASSHGLEKGKEWATSCSLSPRSPAVSSDVVNESSLNTPLEPTGRHDPSNDAASISQPVDQSELEPFPSLPQTPSTTDTPSQTYYSEHEPQVDSMEGHSHKPTNDGPHND
ncbi:hypothetical protein EYZ11_007441 [Aspergillus tanneri]|uniref:Uncharacterized protein n=1 Tax=Aspergillus tanneri TaxID=1220188 RepID=A0A4S3JDF2_9EURO|nr:uncharacterized protein ATNIH1004_004939 [Aspergillus tanneri]KAA8649047.1 hypothetical protein ATNIH1004_004939 [Aspergillus tanneri]THC93075.1 hypothetical protein EYZ11_007441 [Aspergillus tanneri]